MPRDTANWGFNKLEKSDIFINLRVSQNLLAIDTYRPTAEWKITAMQEVTLNGKCRGVRSYVANEPSNDRGVIHGIFTDVSDETLCAELHVAGSKILAAQRLGKTNTILITVGGLNLPRHATFFSGVYHI